MVFIYRSETSHKVAGMLKGSAVILYKTLYFLII